MRTKEKITQFKKLLIVKQILPVSNIAILREQCGEYESQCLDTTVALSLDFWLQVCFVHSGDSTSKLWNKLWRIRRVSWLDSQTKIKDHSRKEDRYAKRTQRHGQWSAFYRNRLRNLCISGLEQVYPLSRRTGAVLCNELLSIRSYKSERVSCKLKGRTFVYRNAK